MSKPDRLLTIKNIYNSYFLLLHLWKKNNLLIKRAPFIYTEEKLSKRARNLLLFAMVESLGQVYFNFLSGKREKTP